MFLFFFIEAKSKWLFVRLLLIQTDNPYYRIESISFVYILSFIF